MKKLVAVSVGTDHHPFDRLVRWVATWASGKDVRVVVQRGTADEVAGVECPTVMPHDELRKLFAAADIVVCHGGPSTVMDARQAGRFPVVVPRDPKFGEHVDGHQMAFAEHLKRHEQAQVVHERDELYALLDRAMVDASEFEFEEQSRSLDGVIAFGRVLDDLLGTSTPITGVAEVSGPEAMRVSAAREEVERW